MFYSRAIDPLLGEEGRRVWTRSVSQVAGAVMMIATAMAIAYYFCRKH